MKKDYTRIINKVLNDENLSSREKKEIIESIRFERDKEYQKDYNIATAKNIGGEALMLGSSVIPFGGAVAGLSATGLKLAQPLMKQIIATSLKKAATEGAISGAMFGFGKGLQEDKNLSGLAHEMANSITTGLLGGAAFGTLGGTIATKFGRGRSLIDTFDKRKDWGIAYRKASGNPELALETLLKNQNGFVPDAYYKKGLGNIDLPWGKHNYETNKGYGIEHILAQRSPQKNMDMKKFWNNFIETLKTGNLIPDKLRKDNINISNEKVKIAIAKNSDYYKGKFPVTAHPQNKSSAKRLAASKPESKPYVDSRIHFTTELNRLIGNITDKSQLFNTHMGKNTASLLNKALIVSTLSILSKINSETSDKTEARENEK